MIFNFRFHVVFAIVLISLPACSKKADSFDEIQGPPPEPLETFISPEPISKAKDIDDILAGAVIKDEDSNQNSGSVLFGFNHNVWRIFLSQKKVEFYAGKQNFGGDIQISINRSETSKIKEIFNKFLNWSETAMKENVQSFQKEIATVGSTTYTFSYEAGNKPFDRSKLVATGPGIRQSLVSDVEKYIVLIRQLPILDKQLKPAIAEFQGLKQAKKDQGKLFN